MKFNMAAVRFTVLLRINVEDEQQNRLFWDMEHDFTV